ncbi:unnamed protein product [Absidia cylindrospora]
MVVTYPDATAKVLVVGTPSGSAVRSIHPVLQNIDHTRQASVDPFLDFKSYPVLVDDTFKVFLDYDLCSSVIYFKELDRHPPFRRRRCNI